MRSCPITSLSSFSLYKRARWTAHISLASFLSLLLIPYAMSLLVKLVAICAFILYTATAIAAAPAHGPMFPIQFPPVSHHGFLCNLPLVSKLLCPRQGSDNGFEVDTPLGKARGTSDVDGAVRLSVRYASAERWKESSVVDAWDLPYVQSNHAVFFLGIDLTPRNGASDVAALPLACPQNNVDSSTYTEDCLSMVLYVPTNLVKAANAPIFMWSVVGIIAVILP